MSGEPVSLSIRSGGEAHWVRVQRNGRRATGTTSALPMGETRSRATGGRARRKIGGADFVRLPGSLANHRVLWVPGEACVVGPNIAVHREAAPGRKEWEREHGEQSLHLLCSLRTVAPSLCNAPI